MNKLALAIILSALTITDGIGQNLISNWSFENNMQLTCQDWFDGCGNELSISCDSMYNCQVRFINESPSLIPEEIWSIGLYADMLQEGLVETYITGQSGTNTYQLEYWMKSPGWWGKVSIGTISQGQFIVSKSRSDSTSIWAQFTLTDTISTLSNDTIAVQLSAGTGDFCICTSYFDFINLSILDTATSISDISLQNAKKVKVYPNPARENITIKIEGNKSETHRFTIYGLHGQVITVFETSNSTFTWESQGVASGMYFYQVQSTTDNQLVAQGKLLISRIED